MAFDEPMDAYADTNVGLSLTGPAGDVPGFVFWQSETEAYFAPSAAWVSGAYTATFDGSAEDLAGNPVGVPLSRSFTVDTSLAPAAPPPAAAAASRGQRLRAWGAARLQLAR
jgi:hypothetical protein